MDDSENDEGFTGRPSSADAIDLLDLVRGAEEDARVSASSPDLLGKIDGAAAAARISEQYVEVGDEAIDLPPSLPPMRSGDRMSTPPERVPPAPPPLRISSVPPPPRPRRAASVRQGENDLGPAMHPALAIVLVVGAVVAALYGLLSLPPL